ncbi:MAG TPA: histidine phosphatase family protein [Ktedonobacterales bacterium]|nr:histidine phosphatase family protein [Ktedonobacterales bacterium]
MNPTLILIRHSLSEVTPDLPATDWPLSIEGRRRCEALADALAPYRPNVIFASHEAKAQETARLVARRLDIPWQVADGLHEHDRSGTPFLSDEAFQATVATFLAHPDGLVFGRETANQAQARFSQAVERVLQTASGAGCIAIVAHGLVISLYLACQRGYTPAQTYAFWRDLSQPDFVVCS